MTTAETSVRQPWSETVAIEIIEAHKTLRGPLLPILHDLQRSFGYVDPKAVPLIASILNVSRAEVHGVVTFYRDFRSAPAGTTQVMICRAEACQALGAAELLQHAQRRLGVGTGSTTADGSVTLDQVFCLGNCALSPAILVDGRLHGRVTEERFDDIISSRLAVADGSGKP